MCIALFSFFFLSLDTSAYDTKREKNNKTRKYLKKKNGKESRDVNNAEIPARRIEKKKKESFVIRDAF